MKKKNPTKNLTVFVSKNHKPQNIEDISYNASHIFGKFFVIA